MLERSAVEAFASRLRGPLLLPESPGYDDARAIWNAMIDRRPAMIARCAGVADVVAGVNFAREQGVPLTIRGGGHNISGLAVCDGGLMLDLSLMRGVWVDPVARTARAQAGCLLADLDRETQLHGLAAVMGFVSNTGIAGLTLGGGFGYLTRRYGWSSDHVRSMEVVTAEGRIVRASPDENGDLFWALCGGGGNFGVVTNFEYGLHPVGPEMLSGAIAWRFEDVREVLAMYAKFAAEAPPDLTCTLVLRVAPPAPWIAREYHGKRVVVLVVCHAGTLAEAERDLAPLKSFGSPVGDALVRRTYVSQQSLLDATQPRGRRYYWKSEYLPRIEPELLERCLPHLERMPSPLSAIIVFPVDGALGRLPESHSPAGNRDAAAVLNITAQWEAPADDAANVEWARSAWRELKRFSTGGTYVNFLTEEEVGDRVRAAYGANYDRLVEVKSKWDPGNLFRMNKNIAPAAG